MKTTAIQFYQDERDDFLNGGPAPPKYISGILCRMASQVEKCARFNDGLGIPLHLLEEAHLHLVSECERLLVDAPLPQGLWRKRAEKSIDDAKASLSADAGDRSPPHKAHGFTESADSETLLTVMDCVNRRPIELIAKEEIARPYAQWAEGEQRAKDTQVDVAASKVRAAIQARGGDTSRAFASWEEFEKLLR